MKNQIKTTVHVGLCYSLNGLVVIVTWNRMLALATGHQGYLTLTFEVFGAEFSVIVNKVVNQIIG